MANNFSPTRLPQLFLPLPWHTPHTYSFHKSIKHFMQKVLFKLNRTTTTGEEVSYSGETTSNNWRRREQKAIKISKHKQGSTITAIKLCSQTEKFLNMFSA